MVFCVAGQHMITADEAKGSRAASIHERGKNVRYFEEERERPQIKMGKSY